MANRAQRWVLGVAFVLAALELLDPPVVGEHGNAYRRFAFAPLEPWYSFYTDTRRLGCELALTVGVAIWLCVSLRSSKRRILGGDWP